MEGPPRAPPSPWFQSRSYEYPLVRPSRSQTLRGSTGIFIPTGLGSITVKRRELQLDTSFSFLVFKSAQSTQYTATRRIKSDYTTVSSELCDDFATRSAMWPSVAGESCESREALAASLTTSCHLRLPVSRLHLPTGMRNPTPNLHLHVPLRRRRPHHGQAQRRHASPPCTPGGRALPGDHP